MKPDGVTTAALEPMEMLEANPANEETTPPGQEPNQAASPVDGEAVPQTQSDAEPPQETPAKSNKKPSADAKSKTPSKTTKTKPGTTPTKSTTASKTAPSRLSNGVSKPQTNSVPKKTPTTASDKKSTPVAAAPKKPTGTTPTPKSTSKTTEKKTPSATPLTNGAKTASTTAKKTPTAASGAKTSSTTAAAKRPPASKPAAPPASKATSTASPKPDKPPVSKATRTASGTSATHPPSSGTMKSSAAAPKPAASKPSTASSKVATSKPTTPSAGKAPTTQTSKTPVKKDVIKSASSTAKKLTESPYAKPNPVPKPAKLEVPKSTIKSGTPPKKPTTSKAVDSKAPTRSKTEGRATSNQDASKTSKTATKASSPKKTVGSSTPTPVKRGPKVPETDKAVAAAVGAAATAATAATIVTKPEEQTSSAVENIQHPEATPTPISEPIQAKAEPAREPTPEPVRVPTPEPVRVPTPEPVRVPTPEPVREPTPEPVREPTPEPVREPTPEPAREPTPELYREPTPEPIREPSPESRELKEQIKKGAELVLDVCEKTTDTSVTSLGTTVLSPPCSPTGAEALQADQTELKLGENTNQEQGEKEVLDEKKSLFTAPFAAAPRMMAEPQILSAAPNFDSFASGRLMSPYEKEEAVEKAEEEINEDDDDDDDDDDENEEDEDGDHKRFGHQPSSMITDLSSSQPSEEIQRSSAFGGSMGWHGDDLLSGMDSEDMSSCTSSRQQGVSDLSSTLHTAILEGTQSSDALVDSSLRGSEGDANLTSSPNVETIANEEEDEDEDERVDDMDLSSERVEEHHMAFSNQEPEEEDEDVEMHSEGKTESGGNVEEDFNEEERSDSLNQCGLPSSNLPSWGQTNPFSDPWSQSASVPPVDSSRQMSDHGAADPETPTQCPAQTGFDSSVPTFAPQSDEEPIHHMSAKDTDLLGAPADVPVRLGGSESSTPEDMREYDSSSGVESRSDKQHTPVPTHGHPDVEQDLGIHMEKVDGEEEEAETLPADEVLGTGPPTAPASAPSSASTSGDEASDTEGEMQINYPGAPRTMAEKAASLSPNPTSNLPTFDEDEEVMRAVSADGEDDEGGATPQSANSVASYGFDCTNSNSNAHSMAESCGKSPGIFSLENEEQLTVEAKDPSLIKELTLPSAGTAAEDLLDRSVNLMPLAHSGDDSRLEEHHYMMGSKMGADLLRDVDPQAPGHLLDMQDSEESDENQPPYYSTTCDKTDSFLQGNDISKEEDEDMLQSQENNQNQNHSESSFIANGHYLALVPGNRRPIDPALAAHIAPLIESHSDSSVVEEQLCRLGQAQEKVWEAQQRREQEQQGQQWLEEERQRLEQHRQLQEQRQELLQLQEQQEQQQKQSKHRLQWQLELELQYRMHQKHLQQQQQLRRSPIGLMLSPSSGLCTIYEAMETSDEEEDLSTQQEIEDDLNQGEYECSAPMLEWNMKVDMVQQLINQTLMLCGDGTCPLLHLPMGAGGSLSPLESSMWPHRLPQLRAPAATVTAVSSYSPDSCCTSPGDWTVVEMETQH